MPVCLAVAMASSRPVRASICRERAAGLIFLYWAFMRIIGIRATAGSARARLCGVAARSWVLLTLAMSFCWGSTQLVKIRSSSQISLSSSSSAAVP